MTDLEIAQSVADAHLSAEFDAVIIDAVLLPTDVVIGRMFMDRKARFSDGSDIHTSRVIGRDGPVFVTRNSRYLVQMVCDTEALRRRAAASPPPPPPLFVADAAASPGISYVAGFMFSEDRTQVALIRKLKPKWQAGKLNAIGGKIEPGEPPHEAMAREFFEETGVASRPGEWEPVADLVGLGFTVYFFAAFSDAVWDVRTIEEEEVYVGPVAGFLVNPTLMANLRVMMSLALDASGIVKPVTFVDEERAAA